jgi:hypothetical protein
MSCGRVLAVARIPERERPRAADRFHQALHQAGIAGVARPAVKARIFNVVSGALGWSVIESQVAIPCLQMDGTIQAMSGSLYG